MIMSHTYDKASSGAKIEGMVTNARTSCPFDNEAFFFFIYSIFPIVILIICTSLVIYCKSYLPHVTRPFENHVNERLPLIATAE